MSSSCGNDFVPLISTIPGPRGPKGDAGSTPSNGSAGKNAFTFTTSAFVMPAVDASVAITVEDSTWVAVGQTLFIEGAGYGIATATPSATSLTWKALDIPTNTASGVTIALGKKVSPGGIAYIDSAALNALTERVVVLETSPGGIRSFRGQSTPSAPAGGFRVGDLWFKTDVSGNIINRYRWDGSGWSEMFDADTSGLVDDVASLQTGVNTLITSVDSLKQEYVLAVVGSGPSRRIAGFRVTVPGGGTDPTEFAIQADKFVILGDDGSGKDSPFFVEGDQSYIKKAFIKELTAENLAVTGDLTGWNFGVVNRLFNPLVTLTPRRYFRSIDFGTSFADGKVFGAGNCLSSGYAHATPVTAYAPGAAGWTSGGVTACPDSDNKVRVQIQGRLIGYTGAILLYCQIGSNTPVALSAISSSDSGNAYIDATRILTGVSLTDTVKIFVAPAAGDGTVVPATCRYEIDATFFNW
jgi:hypothetical protein